MQTIQSLGLINGQWCEAKSKQRFTVNNPFNGECLAQVADMGADEAMAAVEAAENASVGWASAEPAFRKAILDDWADRIEANLDSVNSTAYSRTRQATGTSKSGI